MDPQSKKCTKCGEVKPLKEFARRLRREQRRRSACKSCAKAGQRANSAIYDSSHKGEARERAKAWGRANSERACLRVKIWVAANPKRVRKSKRAWKLANPEKVCATGKAYRTAHPDKIAAKSAGRRARKLKATPTWADEVAIAEIYVEAKLQSKLTGIEHHVDHIVPLKSKLVSGLHVEFNLRVLPKPENLKKGNWVWPDMP